MLPASSYGQPTPTWAQSRQPCSHSISYRVTLSCSRISCGCRISSNHPHPQLCLSNHFFDQFLSLSVDTDLPSLSSLLFLQFLFEESSTFNLFQASIFPLCKKIKASRPNRKEILPPGITMMQRSFPPLLLIVSMLKSVSLPSN